MFDIIFIEINLIYISKRIQLGHQIDKILGYILSLNNRLLIKILKYWIDSHKNTLDYNLTI